MSGRAHAVLSASSAHRWLECTPSAMIEEGLPDSTSVFAEEGNLAHSIGELILRLENKEISKREYNSELKKLKEHKLFYDGMIEEVKLYTDWVMELYKGYKKEDPLTELYIEQRLNYSKYAPEGFGTGDAVIISLKTIHVIDLKFGKGVVVNPHENPQLKLYGLGAYEEYSFLHDIETVRVSVAQVRLDAYGSFETTAKELLKWGEEYVRPRAELAIKGEGEFRPGSWCGFCRFRSKCKARASHFTKIFEDKKGRELSGEEIAELLPLLDEIQKWAKDIQEGALTEILEGGKIPGWKAVEGRSNRRVFDPEGLALRLLQEGRTPEEIYKPLELKTITNLEKLLGKKVFNEVGDPFMEKPQGKPTLAPESDKRPALDDVADELMFD